MTERKFDDFDGFAEEYRNTHTQNVKITGADSFYFAKMKVELLQRFEKNEPLQLLDLGCGDGTTAEFMHQYFSNWLIQGIDISPESVAVATKKNISAAVFNIYDGLNINAADHFYDVIFIAGVLHHVNKKFHRQLMLECFRVLKPGGRLYIFEHNPYNPFTRYLVNTCVFDKDAELLSPYYMQRLLIDCGFTYKEKNFILFFPRKGLLSNLIFAEKFLKKLPLGGQYFFRVTKQ